MRQESEILFKCRGRYGGGVNQKEYTGHKEE